MVSSFAAKSMYRLPTNGADQTILQDNEISIADEQQFEL